MQPPTWSIRACHALLLSSGMCVAPFLRTCDEAWGSRPQFNITHSALGSPAYCTGASYATASAPQVHEKKSHNPLRSRTPLYVCGCGGGRGGKQLPPPKPVTSLQCNIPCCNPQYPEPNCNLPNQQPVMTAPLHLHHRTPMTWTLHMPLHNIL